MTTNQPPDSLTGALAKAQIPAENHEYIRRFTTAVGIDDYRVVESGKTHIRAKRRDGGPDLFIYYGYTNGFTSEEDVVRAVGPGCERKPSSRKGTWYVTHPVDQVATRSPRSRDVRREGNFCTCGMQKSLTGVCANCD